MRRYSATFLTLPLALLVAACGERTPDYEATDLSDNVLLAEWTGPYGGVPAFDEMDLADLKPALEKGMELELAEIDAIANNEDPPTFENTIVALEGVGQDLDRVFTYRGIWSSNLIVSRVPRDPDGDGAEIGRAPDEDHSERGPVRANSRRLRE